MARKRLLYVVPKTAEAYVVVNVEGKYLGKLFMSRTGFAATGGYTPHWFATLQDATKYKTKARAERAAKEHRGKVRFVRWQVKP